jgi:uncharacterized protein (DUF2147 family)
MSSWTRFKQMVPVLVIGPLAMLGAAQATAGGDVTGVWVTGDGTGAIEIAPCGDKRCGQIVWLQKLVDDKGQPRLDDKNPDASKRSRPLCGIQIIDGLQRQSDGAWDAGTVYDPDEGRTASFAARLKSETELEVKGYELVKFLSLTTVWKKAPADLGRCKS